MEVGVGLNGQSLAKFAWLTDFDLGWNLFDKNHGSMQPYFQRNGPILLQLIPPVWEGTVLGQH